MSITGPNRGDEIEDADVGLACLCGSENFERVVVQREPAALIVTDFVACIGCSAMYFFCQPGARDLRV